MNTVDHVIGLLMAGKKPESLWLRPEVVEFHYPMNEVISLGLSIERDERRRNAADLARIVVLCNWETSRRKAKNKIIKAPTDHDGQFYPALYP